MQGYGISNGYLNNEPATLKNFISNPFGNGKVYRTGDLGRFNQDGEIQYIGRLDNQIKIRGIRIELEEIENKINDLPYINSCVVIKSKNSQSHEYLCAYYTANEEINQADIREHLNKILPKYMIPSYFMQLDNLPYTHSGKIDRKKLPEPKHTSTRAKVIPPRNDVDSSLLKLLKSLLDIDIISLDDNFFDIGGDSLSAINLCVQVQNEFNVQLYVKDIMEHAVIQDLSDIILKSRNSSKAEIIMPVPKADYYPVSSAQKRIYFTTQMAGSNSILYNISGGIILDGIIDHKALENHLNTLINRHEALRTSFEINGDNVVQKISDNISFKLDLLESANFGDLNLIFKDFVKPFDLSKAPLFRAKLIKFTNGKSVLLIDMHHIISDGTSFSILADELCMLYNGKSLPTISTTYKDFSAFENKRLTSGKLKTAENYWVNQFKNDIPVLNLPLSHPRPAVQSFEGKKLYSSIDSNTALKINELSKALGVTPYIILLSSYYILLSKYTSQDDIVVGSPIVGRDIANTYNLIGMFVNTLALRAHIDNNLPFKQFILNIKENMLEAYKYQTYPFDELVNKLNIKKDTSRNPLFDTMFLYQNNGYKDIEFDGIKSEYYIPDTHISKFDLSLEALPTNNGEIKLSFEYATSLFDEEFIKNMASHYLNILKTILDNADIKILDIDMLSEKEKNKILCKFNDTENNYPQNKTLVDLFEEQVKKTPNNIAVVFENNHLTYKELNGKANSLARYLREKQNINKNDLVAIMVNRSIEMIIAIIAVLKSGGAYIPIDPAYPKDRINYMLNNSNSKVLLTQKDLENNIDFSNKIFIDLNNENTYCLSEKNLKPINNPEDLAYTIFTSGSTGNPKGVMLKHKNIINFIYGIMKEFDFSVSQTIVSVTTVSFDIFVFESLLPLLNGLKVVIANEKEQTDKKLFNDLCLKNNVDIIQTTPSRIQGFLLSNDYLDFLKQSTHILLGGEPFPPTLLSNIKQISDAKIYNMYGPTETAVWSTFKDLTNTDIITIGHPISNTQVYILDSNLKLLPIGVIGEIYISGDGVSKGYLNNSELTNKSFIPNPFIPNTLMYKTGDIGIYASNGEIICLGRSDNQVKIRGLRIELGEIENNILKYPHIKNAAVIKQIIENREFISCYFVADKRIKINELRKYLSKALPRYMVPSYFIALDNLPYTPNGKLDRKSLPLPTEILDITEEKYIAPKTKLQKQLVTIWEKVLNTKPIGINDNFFALGGDSLLAMNLNVELLKVSSKISYADIFRYPTIAELEEKINSNNDDPLFKKVDSLSDKYVHILKNSKKNEKIKTLHPKSILLTGATGFLGVHILEQFINNETGNVYCIIREEPNLTSRAKLHQKLNYYFGDKYDELIDKRIFAVTGDISKPGFGLNQDDLLSLANSVDIVINSAANVAHFGNYNDFYKSNVTSVKYAIDFCKSFNIKLYHISTVSVTGLNLDSSYLLYKKKQWLKKNKNNDIIFDEASFYIGQVLENVYARSKFEAENYILNAISEGLDGYILRMGHLMPRIRDGIFQENILDNDLINKITTFIKIGFIPDYLLNYKLEITPVDQAANAIYKLATHYTNSNRIFHLFNHNYISGNGLLKMLKKSDYNIKVLPEPEFKDKINLMLKSEADKGLLKNIFNDFDSNLHLNYENNIKINSKFTIRYLRKVHFKWEKISSKYLIRLIKLFRKVI